MKTLSLKPDKTKFQKELAEKNIKLIRKDLTNMQSQLKKEGGNNLQNVIDFLQAKGIVNGLRSWANDYACNKATFAASILRLDSPPSVKTFGEKRGTTNGSQDHYYSTKHFGTGSETFRGGQGFQKKYKKYQNIFSRA